MRNFLISSIVFLAVCTSASADEGMWMVNAISRALVQKMQSEGLQLRPDEIYDADKVSLTDAIVSLDFGCTGSMVSGQGLLITNHHCAYSDVHALSTPEHNYLEDGFFAGTPSEEIYIPGKQAFFLKKVIDVTDETNALIESEQTAGKPFGSRRISYLLETKYHNQTGYEASLSSMWAGSRYYMALYEVFTDIRLVAAPPVSISAFGGDIDNWEWPQHKCDFALYRIYSDKDGKPAAHSEANVPYSPSRWLRISTAGYNEGDFAMVIGYPGVTDRYSSSAKVRFRESVTLPIQTKARAEEMAIMKKWMDKDPAVRLKYADRFFSLSNVQENEEGMLQCLRRFNPVKDKKAAERSLKGKENKQMLRSLSEKYRAIEKAEKNLTWYRESLVRGTRLEVIAVRLKNLHSAPDPEKEYADLDMRVEKELFRQALENFYSNVDSTFWGPYQTEVRERFVEDGGRTDFDKMTDYLWTDDYMSKEDRIYKFFNDITIAQFNKAVDDAQGEPTVSRLGRQYTQALYRMREDSGVLQYPDANSTMRLTFGTVGGYNRDGVKLPWQTRTGEILAKEDSSSYDFSLKPFWREELQSDRDIPVNFLTDNDITGGNSGSPVLNAQGELTGLAFDGNKESLASDVAWTEGFNKCVCVDIRYVLWALRHWAHADSILKELGQQ